jgi:predicted small secreted protein
VFGVLSYRFILAGRRDGPGDHVMPAAGCLARDWVLEIRRNTQGTSNMRKNLSIALALLALIGLAPLLGACNTTAGAGEDISAGGHAITHEADKLAH